MAHNEPTTAALLAGAREFRLRAEIAVGVPEVHASMIGLAREYERIAQQRQKLRERVVSPGNSIGNWRISE